MKKRIVFFFHSALFIGIFSTYAKAQLSQKAALDSIAARLQSGIYERTLNLGYIPSPAKFSRNDVPIPHNEFTMMILRFYELSYDSTGKYYIGKVFMGERYLESHYNKKYNNVAAYMKDKDGFFMTCKLFYHERSMEYRLNIYPEYILNFCDKACDPFMGMHFNTKKCINTAAHWQAIRYLAGLDDKSYQDISEENDSTQIHEFMSSAARSKINIDTSFIKETSNFDDLKNKERNLIREINLRKYIKCFMVGNFDESPTDLAKSLKLRFTKYSLSEDILENAEYEFQFLPLNQYSNDYLRLRSTNRIFMTRNPLYRSLAVSFEPDETYIPEIPKLDIFTYYDDGSNTVIPYRSAKNNTGTDVKRVEKELNEEIYKKQQQRRQQQKQIPQINQEVIEKKQNIITISLSETLLDSLRNYINIVSTDRSPRSWIYWPNSKKDNDTIVIQKDTYLRDGYPIKLDSVRVLAALPIAVKGRWLRGGIKGIAKQNEAYKVISSYQEKKQIWLQVEKIDLTMPNRKKSSSM